MTRQAPQGTSAARQVSLALIGLAVAARIARDPRTYETAIVVALVVAGLAGIERASRASAFERLAAWDKRAASRLEQTAVREHSRLEHTVKRERRRLIRRG